MTTRWVLFAIACTTVSMSVSVAGCGAWGGDAATDDDVEAVAGEPISCCNTYSPGNLRVTGTTTTSVALAWTEPTDVSRFNRYVVRDRQTGGSTFALVAKITSPTTLAYTVTGLAPASSYDFVVEQRSNGGKLLGVSTIVAGTTASVVSGGDAGAPADGGTGSDGGSGTDAGTGSDGGGVSNAPPPAAGWITATVPPSAPNTPTLPSDATCAAQVHRSSWEPRPENAQQNATMPPAGAMASAFAARPRDQGGSYDPRWDSWLLARVDGQFTGTTDEIFQWAACKWGLPDNLLRGIAVRESTWFAYLHFPGDASSGGGGGGSAYWDRGSGDAFSSATAASTTYCNGIATLGLLASEVHDYQKDPLTSVGGYPFTPGPGLCPKTFSIVGVMAWDDPAWEAPYAPYPGNQNGTFPFTRDSTAAAVDYLGSYLRGCYEGWEVWMKNSGNGSYAAGDIWGCVGSWYAGDWHSTAGDAYAGRVQSEITNATWLTASFDDSKQQYQCDPTYGCPQ